MSDTPQAPPAPPPGVEPLNVTLPDGRIAWAYPIAPEAPPAPAPPVAGAAPPPPPPPPGPPPPLTDADRVQQWRELRDKVGPFRASAMIARGLGIRR